MCVCMGAHRCKHCEAQGYTARHTTQRSSKGRAKVGQSGWRAREWECPSARPIRSAAGKRARAFRKLQHTDAGRRAVCVLVHVCRRRRRACTRPIVLVSRLPPASLPPPRAEPLPHHRRCYPTRRCNGGREGELATRCYAGSCSTEILLLLPQQVRKLRSLARAMPLLTAFPQPRSCAHNFFSRSLVFSPRSLAQFSLLLARGVRFDVFV